jgi:membrane protein implicated in regulation of membrane protease activity
MNGSLPEWLYGIAAHWAWLTLGVLLAGLEMLLPGYYLIWIALAAIATGVLTGLLALGLPLQVAVFGALALVTVFSARRFLNNNPIESADPLMNHRGARMVGQTARVVQAIRHGTGRVHVGDGQWNARGLDAAVGEWVQITGNDGSTLLVEPIAAPGEDPAG